MLTEIEQLQETIVSLESQIDDLKYDLRAANDKAAEWEQFAGKLHSALDDIIYSAKEAIK